MDWYSTFTVVPHTQGAQVRITQCYLQITLYLPLPCKRSPDGASPDWGCRHLIAAYYSFIYPERTKGWVGLVELTYSRWSPVSCRSSARQGNFAGQKPTFYHWTTQTTSSSSSSSIRQFLTHRNMLPPDHCKGAFKISRRSNINCLLRSSFKIPRQKYCIRTSEMRLIWGRLERR